MLKGSKKEDRGTCTGDRGRNSLVDRVSLKREEGHRNLQKEYLHSVGQRRHCEVIRGLQVIKKRGRMKGSTSLLEGEDSRAAAASNSAALSLASIWAHRAFKASPVACSMAIRAAVTSRGEAVAILSPATETVI